MFKNTLLSPSLLNDSSGEQRVLGWPLLSHSARKTLLRCSFAYNATEKPEVKLQVKYLCFHIIFRIFSLSLLKKKNSVLERAPLSLHHILLCISCCARTRVHSKDPNFLYVWELINHLKINFVLEYIKIEKVHEMSESSSLPQIHSQALTHSVTLFRDGASKEVMKVKWSYKGRVLLW